MVSHIWKYAVTLEKNEMKHGILLLWAAEIRIEMSIALASVKAERKASYVGQRVHGEARRDTKQQHS